MKKEDMSCIDCAVKNCNKMDKTYPDFCLTTHMDEEVLNEAMECCEGVGVNMCNPILQAKLLNKAKTDLNVVCSFFRWIKREMLEWDIFMYL